MSEQMIIRIDPKTKSAFSRLARAEGKSSSQMVRELIADYIHNRDIGGYLDDLWERSGRKMKRKRMSLQDIDRIIQEIRAGKS